MVGLPPGRRLRCGGGRLEIPGLWYGLGTCRCDYFQSKKIQSAGHHENWSSAWKTVFELGRLKIRVDVGPGNFDFLQGKENTVCRPSRKIIFRLEEYLGWGVRKMIVDPSPQYQFVGNGIRVGCGSARHRGVWPGRHLWFGRELVKLQGGVRDDMTKSDVVV